MSVSYHRLCRIHRQCPNRINMAGDSPRTADAIYRLRQRQSPAGSDEGQESGQLLHFIVTLLSSKYDTFSIISLEFCNYPFSGYIVYELERVNAKLKGRSTQYRQLFTQWIYCLVSQQPSTISMYRFVGNELFLIFGNGVFLPPYNWSLLQFIFK